METDSSNAQPITGEVRAVLNEGRYTIADIGTLKGVLSDAFFLYDVAAGQRRLSELLALIEKKTDPEVFSLIVVDLARFLGPRLRKVVSELAELQQDQAATLADSFAPVLERRLAAVQAMKRRLRELWAEAGVTDTAAVQVVSEEICRQIQSDPLAAGRIESGDFSDVDRLFQECLRAPKGLVQ